MVPWLFGAQHFATILWSVKKAQLGATHHTNHDSPIFCLSPLDTSLKQKTKSAPGVTCLIGIAGWCARNLTSRAKWQTMCNSRLDSSLLVTLNPTDAQCQQQKDKCKRFSCCPSLHELDSEILRPILEWTVLSPGQSSNDTAGVATPASDNWTISTCFKNSMLPPMKEDLRGSATSFPFNACCT